MGLFQGSFWGIKQSILILEGLIFDTFLVLTRVISSVALSGTKLLSNQAVNLHYSIQYDPYSGTIASNIFE